MAGDWIPIRINLSTDPRTVAIATRIHKHVLHTVGALSVVWGAANEHTTDGRLMGYTLEAIDAMVGIKGFAAAMEAVGWMTHDDVSVTVPDFQRYNSDGAKARLQGARRAARLRNAKGARCAHESNADTVTNGARKAHVERTKSAPTEQKRTEEKNSSSSSAASAVAAAADSCPILQALHERGIGEPTAMMLRDEGCTQADIRAADKAHEPGDGPGLAVNRIRESMAARSTTAAREAIRAAGVAAWRELAEAAQAERIASFRAVCAAEGVEVRHMADGALTAWRKFIEWFATEVAKTGGAS